MSCKKTRNDTNKADLCAVWLDEKIAQENYIINVSLKLVIKARERRLYKQKDKRE